MKKEKVDTCVCLDCGSRCCKYVATEIDTPKSKRSFDFIRWYLMHKNVNVFIDHAGAWMLEFATECDELGKKGLCMNYNDRPRICRNHGNDEDEEVCEFLSEEEPHVVHFKTAKEFEEYLDSKHIDWRWKNP